MDTDSCSFRFLLFQKQDKVNLTFAISSFLPSFLFLLHAFSLIAFSFTPFCNTTPIIPTHFLYSHALLPLALPFSPAFLSFSHSLSFSHFLSFLFWKRYRYPPLFLNCRSRDSRPRRARLRGLPPATILPTQQQQGRFTSLIPRHLSSLRD